MHEIGTSASQTEEQAAYASEVQAFAAEMASIDRANIHFVPFYTKEHLGNLLRNYFIRLAIYQSQMDRLIDETTSDEEFAELAG